MLVNAWNAHNVPDHIQLKSFQISFYFLIDAQTKF